VTVFENVTVGTTLHKFSATDSDTAINKLFTSVCLAYQRVDDDNNQSINHSVSQVIINNSKYVGPAHCQAEMYAGRVACCPLVTHVEYGPRVVLRLQERWDRQTD